ncbi:MAG: hypothetical protein QME14_07745 [Methanobacteriaceae archaeon]|nr:hypothetical protein [Methanobacteriaceae archaeon]
MSINYKILLIAISIPSIFIIQWQMGALIEFIFPKITIFINLDTFITFLLIFLSSMGVSFLLKLNFKKSLSYGLLIGFMGEIVSIILITIFAVLIQLLSDNLSLDVFTIDIFYYYMIPRLLFQMLNGGLGGYIGYLFVKLK